MLARAVVGGQEPRLAFVGCVDRHKWAWVSLVGSGGDVRSRSGRLPRPPPGRDPNRPFVCLQRARRLAQAHDGGAASRVKARNLRENDLSDRGVARIRTWPRAPRRAADSLHYAPQVETEAQPTEVGMEATITCPLCGTSAREPMPQNACQYFYVCSGCGERLAPIPGDCCVFCSYSDSACPPKQKEGR
jgi:hypothetical protein